MRYGAPEIFNSDSNNAGAGSSRLRYCFHGSSAGDELVPRRAPGLLTQTLIDWLHVFPWTCRRLEHRAERFSLADACDSRRA